MTIKQRVNDNGQYNQWYRVLHKYNTSSIHNLCMNKGQQQRCGKEFVTEQSHMYNACNTVQCNGWITGYAGICNLKQGTAPGIANICEYLMHVIHLCDGMHLISTAFYACDVYNTI